MTASEGMADLISTSKTHLTSICKGEETLMYEPQSTSFCEGDCSTKTSVSKGHSSDIMSTSKGDRLDTMSVSDRDNMDTMSASNGDSTVKSKHNGEYRST